MLLLTLLLLPAQPTEVRPCDSATAEQSAEGRDFFKTNPAIEFASGRYVQYGLPNYWWSSDLKHVGTHASVWIARASDADFIGDRIFNHIRPCEWQG